MTEETGSQYKIPFHKLIKYLCEKAGYKTSEEIGRETGISPGTLRPFFNGVNKTLGTENMAEMLRLLKVPLYELIDMAKAGIWDYEQTEKDNKGALIAIQDPETAYKKMVEAHIQNVKDYISHPLQVWESPDNQSKIDTVYLKPPRYAGNAKYEAYICRYPHYSPDIMPGDYMIVDRSMKPRSNMLVYFKNKDIWQIGRYSEDVDSDNIIMYKIRIHPHNDEFIYIKGDDYSNILPIIFLERDVLRLYIRMNTSHTPPRT